MDRTTVRNFRSADHRVRIGLNQNIGQEAAIRRESSIADDELLPRKLDRLARLMDRSRLTAQSAGLLRKRRRGIIGGDFSAPAFFTIRLNFLHSQKHFVD